jgi:NAD(P)-dependent dehydrogenase (short-subunit alcohol dehydrogenase family)
MSWSIGAGLEEKGVVVTGAAGGIGKAIVEGFAAAGAHVCAIDLRREAVEQMVNSLPQTVAAPPGARASSGRPHLAIGADLMDLQSHEALLRRALEAFGRFDVLVHTAAVLRRRYDLDQISEEDWDVQLDVNLKATFFLNRAAAKLMREQGRGGRIINFSSQGWWTGGFGGSVAYAASKGGIVSMSRGLARTLAPYDITVNTIAPGFVDTPMLVEGVPEKQLEEWKQMVPLGKRFTRPEEVAAPVLFLASDLASHITSTTINVTGGQLVY